jgi:hypothetical protein
VLELLAYFTYCSPMISLQLWSLWPQIVTALNDWAIDFFENVRLQTCHCICRGNQTASNLGSCEDAVVWLPLYLHWAVQASISACQQQVCSECRLLRGCFAAGAGGAG